MRACDTDRANCLDYDCVLLTDCSGATSPDFCTDAIHYNVKQCFVADSGALLAGCDAPVEER